MSIESHRRVGQGVTVGNCRTNRLLFADELYCMRGSSQQGLQHVFHRFSDACGQTETQISAKALEHCVSQDVQGSVFYKRRGNTHQQVETFKYFRVIFTSDGNRKKYIEIRLLKQMQICVRFFAPW